MYLSRTFLFVFFFIFNAGANAQESLQYSLNKNDVFLIQQEVQQLMVNSIDDTEQQISNSILGLMEFSVVESLKDSYKLTMSYKRLKMVSESNIAGELFNVDTNQESSDDLMNMTFQGLLNVPVSFIMDKQGKVTHVSGSKELIKNMLKGFEGILSEDLMYQMEANLQKDFGSEALAKSFEQMTFFYPEKSVAKGECWENEYSGNLSALNTWQLKDCNSSDEYTIEGKSEVVLNTEDEEVKMSLKGIQETKVICDSESGFLTKMIVEQNSKGISIFKNIDPNAQSSTTLKSTIIYKRI